MKLADLSDDDLLARIRNVCDERRRLLAEGDCGVRGRDRTLLVYRDGSAVPVLFFAG